MKKYRAAFHAIIIAVLISSLSIPLAFSASIYSTIQFRRGTAAAWTAADNVLAAGEPGYETDTGLFKIGDGLTHWTDLSYYNRIGTDNAGNLTGILGITGTGAGNISGFDNLTLTGNLSGDGTGTLTGFLMPASVINDNTITSAKLLDNTIQSGKIQDNTIASSKILDNTISLSKINHSGTASSTTFLRGDGAWSSIPQVSSYKNLVITTPADNQNVTITADKVLVTDTNDLARMLSSVSLTVALDASGANGLDNGSLAANTGYFLYVIDNGATTAGLASTSATSPVMPSGYTFKALVGWCTTDNTATPFNIEEFTQVDDEYLWTVAQKVLTASGSTTTTAMDLAAGGALSYAVVPPSITRGIHGKATNPNAGNVVVFYKDVTFSDGLSADSDTTLATYLSSTSVLTANFFLPLLSTSQTFYYQMASGTASMYITGFTLKR